MAPRRELHNDSAAEAVTVEICVDSLALALAAQRGGADRIELCGPLRDGGITPSAGLLQAARQALHIPIAVLIRPRTGPFTVSSDEFEVMRRDLLFSKGTGADIAVLGILNPDRTVDIPRTRELVELAHPMAVTFHRAFDLCPDPHKALGDVMETGAARILTSGGARSAIQGAPLVRTLRAAAAGRIALLLCGALREQTAPDAATLSGVHQIHAALRHRRPALSGGAPTPPQLDAFATAVANLKRSVNHLPIPA